MRSLRKGLALERYVLYNQNNRQADWRKRFASRPESDSQAAKAAQFLRGEVMSKRKRLVSILALAAMTTSLFAGLAGCGKNEDPGQGGGGGQKKSSKDSIVIATMSETPSLTNNEHSAVAGVYMNLLTYEGLLRQDMNVQPELCLAESYEAVSDTEWDFKIRKGVKFHNGDEMTVEDVKASLDWHKNFPLIKTSTENIKQVDIIDDETVRITTYEPCALILSNLTGTYNAVLPKKLIDEGNNFNENPIGTGPYVFKNWNMGDSLEFEAFPDYWGGEPAIKHMTWKIIPEGSSRTIALEAGEIDFVVEVEQMDIERLESNDDITVYKYEATDANFLTLNHEKGALGNKLVRHAINSAIDKDSVVTVAANELGTVMKGQSPANLVGGYDENADVFDPAKAKEYLAQSGVNPQDVTFAIICSNDMKKRAGEVIQANLREHLGIECTLESMDLATYLSATSEGNFTACIGGLNSTDTVGYLKSLFHSESIGGANRSRYVDSYVDETIEKLYVTLDDDERYALCEELNEYLNEECVIIPLWQPIAVRAYQKDLQGVEINAGGTLYFKDCYWGE
jgi:peptide/nickel transport system substrate-binding protein